MKLLKRIVEMIFIFLLPIICLLLCFKTTKVYDENNNEVSKYLEFNNVFILQEESKTYYNYEYYEHDEIIFLNANEPLLVNYNISPFIQNSANSTDFNSVLYYNYNGNYLFILPNESGSISSSGTADYETITYDEFNVTYIRLNQGLYYKNAFDNYIKNINSYTINKNIVNDVFNIIFDGFGISNNYILQILVVYIMLVIIMLLIWYVVYVPIDLLFGLLLRRLSYYN